MALMNKEKDTKVIWTNMVVSFLYVRALVKSV